MTINIPERLCSRKLWVTVVAYGIVLAPLLGVDISSQIQQIMASTGPAYIMAQGLVDALSNKAPSSVTTTINPPAE